MKKLILASCVLLLVGGILLVGCEKKEEAPKVGDVVEKAKDTTSEAGRAAEEAAKEAEKKASDAVDTAKEATKDVAWCGKCGEIKGSDKCCKPGAKKCAKCGLNKGSAGCCKKS